MVKYVIEAIQNTDKDFGFTHVSDEEIVMENLTVKKLYAQVDILRELIYNDVLPMLEELNKNKSSHFIKWDASRRNQTLTSLINTLLEAINQ